MLARSFLFAPADSDRKMEKAFVSGADAIILDLEDSVVEANKANARNEAASFLSAHRSSGGPQIWVRINPWNGSHAMADLEGVVEALPFGIVLPKPDSARQAIELSECLGRLESGAGLPAGAIRILPIATETPRSLFHLHTYVDVGARLAGLTWGAEDLSAAIGAVSARDEAGELTPPYQLARSLCLAGAAAAEVPAIETVYPDFRDLDGLAAYVARGRRDGFLSMMAIHPAQVDVINAGFSPSDAEIDFAQKVVDAFSANPHAATLAMGGKMLDRPHLIQAKRLLDRVAH